MPDPKERARRFVVAGLSRLPARWAVSTRDHMWNSRSTRPLWDKVTGQVLHHWPISPLGDFTLPDDPSLRFDAIDAWMMQQLFWFGRTGYEPGESELWADACTRAEHIVEIGANVGWYAVLGARANRSARYVAVEPQPAAAASLRKSLALNGLDRVQVVEAAVVGPDAPERVRLNFPDATAHNPAPGRAFVSGAEYQLLEAHRSVSVATVRAADVVKGADLVKLDIEGMEAEVLAAAEPAIAEHRPAIFLELQPEAVNLRALVDRWRAAYRYDVVEAGWRDVVLTPR